MKSRIFILILVDIFLFWIFPMALHAQVLPNSSFERIFYISPRINSLPSIEAHAGSIDILAPQTYEVLANLTASGSVDATIKNAIASTATPTHRIALMPLIANNGFSRDIIHNLLMSPAAQAELIQYLISEAKTQGYIGWQFDFENIYYTDRDRYSAFVAQAAKSLQENGLMLSIAVVSRTDDSISDFYENWSGAYDYAKLAQSANFLSLMTYDDPDSIGPTASMPFIQKVYTYLESQSPPIPTSKLSLGVPLYYWGWSLQPFKKINPGGMYSRIATIEASYPYMSGFNSTFQTPYIIYTLGGKQYIIWYDNAVSMSAKINFAEANGFAGSSAWVLGDEDPDVWSAFAAAK